MLDHVSTVSLIHFEAVGIGNVAFAFILYKHEGVFGNSAIDFTVLSNIYLRY